MISIIKRIQSYIFLTKIKIYNASVQDKFLLFRAFTFTSYDNRSHKNIFHDFPRTFAWFLMILITFSLKK